MAATDDPQLYPITLIINSFISNGKLINIMNKYNEENSLLRVTYKNISHMPMASVSCKLSRSKPTFILHLQFTLIAGMHKHSACLHIAT